MITNHCPKMLRSQQMISRALNRKACKFPLNYKYMAGISLMKPNQAFQSPCIRSLHMSTALFKHENEGETPNNVVDEEENDEEDEEDQGLPSEKYIGVSYHENRMKKWSAHLIVGDYDVDGGEYWTEEDAARGYDELVRLYSDDDAQLNFPDTNDDEDEIEESNVVVKQSGDWQLPNAGRRQADIIPPIAGQKLTLEELLHALENEQAIDVYTINLEGKSSLADYMVFCTGKSRAHMRRMADMIVMSIKARNMKDDFGYVVEGRDCDDWMITDIDNIIVHYMREDTRRMLKLEDHWENMVNDKHRIYGHLSEEEYMDKYGTSELMDEITDDDIISEDNIDKEVWKYIIFH